LRTLAVAPWAQGHGYGRALCVWCITRARHEQARALVLHTAEFMTAARKLYEGLGFHRRPSHDLLASDVLRLSAGQVDQKIMGYALTIVQSGSGTSY
jgi:ribosomal protein S18 acetylase RimI-like enzyme